MTSIQYPNLSLVNYMNSNAKDTASSASTSAVTGGNAVPQMPSLADYLGQDSDTVAFSSLAQTLSASQSITGAYSFTPDADGGESAKVGCGDFISQFLEDSGVNLDDISDETQKLLDGLADLVANMGAVTRDSKIDDMTKAYVKGQRESYTLQGDGVRLSATVQYDKGVPQSLTITQLQGGVASTATLTLGKNADGNLSQLNVARVQKEYTSLGGLVGTTEAEPLSLSLYA